MKKLALLFLVFLVVAPALAQPRPRVKPTPAAATPTPTPTDPAEQDKQELDAIAPLPAAERVAILQAWREKKPDSPLAARALEDLLRARAAWGDELLRAGNTDGGLDQFELVLKECPKENISDRLFADVLRVMPAGLYLRGQRGAAVLAAQEVEKLVRPNPQRLLSVALFYLSLEDGANALRLADEVVKLSPESAAAHQALGAARHINLQLEEALAGYQKSYELDPNSAATRRSLADMLRANGKPEEALKLYRQQLETDPKDRLARAGVALSLLEAGQREEGEKELETALADDPNNLPLLAGAAYWWAARGENEKALDLAQRAVQIEPRYTWGQVALARALLGRSRPFEAERALRFAQQYGRFPTLSYELATVLAQQGRYEEAAEELARAFSVKDGKISASLAGRQDSSQDDFRDLLAPERRAGLFQPTTADSEANARQLKSLLAFHTALHPSGDQTQPDENALSRAAREFGGGADSMAAFRQLYAANRLMRAGLSPQTVGALMGAAPAGVDKALDQPYSAVAVMADDYPRLSQTQAFANPQPALTPAQRLAFSRLVRGRIEDLAGWSYLAQDDADEAIVRFRRALSVLPENTSWWRTAQWHIGAALEAKGMSKEALDAYLKGYNKAAPDLVRRAVVERLYRQVKGTTDGLEELVGPSPVIAAAPVGETSPAPAASESPVPTPAASESLVSTPEPTPEAKAETSPTPEPKAETMPETTPAATPEPTPEAQPATKPTPDTEATPAPETTPAPSPETVVAPTPAPDTEVKPAPTPGPETEATPAPKTGTTPEVTPNPSPETSPAPTPEPENQPETKTDEPKKNDDTSEPEEPPKSEPPPTDGATRPRRVNLPGEKKAPDKPSGKNKKPDKPKKPDNP